MVLDATDGVSPGGLVGVRLVDGMVGARRHDGVFATPSPHDHAAMA